jgi:hypothetical protein
MLERHQHLIVEFIREHTKNKSTTIKIRSAKVKQRNTNTEANKRKNVPD